MRLTVEEINAILNALRSVHGAGYAKDPKIAALQAKLSIMLEVAQAREVSHD